MDLVDAHRRAPRIGRFRAFGKCQIRPDEMFGLRDDGTRGGAHFAGESDRVGLERQEVPVARDDFIFVDGAFANSGGENFPEPGIDSFAHLMRTAVPAVEGADHPDPQRMRRPDGEMRPLDPLETQRVGAKPVVDLAMSALNKKIVVDFPEHGAECIGVFIIPGSARVLRPQSIAETARSARGEALEKTAATPGQNNRRSILDERAEAFGIRRERADGDARRRLMRAKHRKGIWMPAAQQGFGVNGADAPGRIGGGSGIDAGCAHFSRFPAAGPEHSRCPARIPRSSGRRRTSPYSLC